MNLPALSISYAWKDRIRGLLWLASFSHTHNVFKVHPCCSMCQDSIYFHVWIIFYRMDIPQSVYPYISWWTLGLLWNKVATCLCTSFWVNVHFQLSYVHTLRNGIVWSHGDYPLHRSQFCCGKGTSYNSMKLWAKPCMATQERRVTVKSSAKTWSTGGGNGKSLQHSCHDLVTVFRHNLATEQQ